MNILFITTKCPLPTNDGHSLRSFNLLKQVAAVHTVHLLSFVKYQQEYNSIPELETICSSVTLMDLPENTSKTALYRTLILSVIAGKAFVTCKYDTLQMREKIREKIQEIDLIHFDMLPLAVYLDETNGLPTVLNEHNVESLLLQRRLENEKGILKKWFFSRQQKLLEKFERNVCRNVHSIITCSENDLTTIKTFAPHTRVDVVPNGVDTSYFSPLVSEPEEPHSMIFIGGLNWFPNYDALEWFDSSIFPEILNQFPDAHLHIIGIMSDTFPWKHPQATTCYGFVDDIRPYMAKASLFIVPLRIGGGTRLKILNAMAMGKPVISTTIGAEGLGVTSGENILLADDEKTFSKMTGTLFNQSTARKTLSINARKYINDHYQWKHIGKKLLNVYNSVSGEKRKIT